MPDGDAPLTQKATRKERQYTLTVPHNAVKTFPLSLFFFFINLSVGPTVCLMVQNSMLTSESSSPHCGPYAKTCYSRSYPTKRPAIDTCTARNVISAPRVEIVTLSLISLVFWVSLVMMSRLKLKLTHV